MAFVSKLFLFSSNSLRFNKAGALATHVRQKLLCASSYHRLEILNINKELKTVRSFNDYGPVSKRKQKPVLSSKFGKLNLPFILNNAENLTQGFLMATFHKLCIIYHGNKNAMGFQKQMDHFVKSHQFRNFCSALHKELPKLTPAQLPILLNLVYFKVSTGSVLMKKVFALILDNLHCLSVCDLLEVYSELKQRVFDNTEEAIKLREACELYFNSYFEDEISQCQYINDLVHFVSDKSLPLKVRQLITEKFLEEIDSGKYHLPIYPRFYYTAFYEPISSIYRDSLIEKLKIIITEHQTPIALKSFTNLYKAGVQKYEYLYDEELCKKFASIALEFRSTALTGVANNLIQIGYFNQEMIDQVIDSFLSTDIFRFKPPVVVNAASIFARTCIHKMNYPNWNKIKEMLESYAATLGVLGYPDLAYNFCKYLTFLECDPTKLSEKIFAHASDLDFYCSSADSRKLLRLHHLTRKYFPDTNLGLSRKALNHLVQIAAYKKHFFSISKLNEFFGGEDYVLPNCLSPEFQFLPAVVLLGPDNKPVNLSSYKGKNLDIFFNHNFKVVTNINNIKKPPGSRIIVFIEFSDGQPIQFRNAPLTSGYWQTFMKAYEGIDCDVVLLRHPFFFLDDTKKLEYLKNEVGKIIGESEAAEIGL